MKFVEKFAAVFVAVICLFLIPFQVSAKTIDYLEWNEYEDCVMVAEEDVPSNSDLKTAQLKFRYEEGNRIVMFIMLTFSGNEGEEDPRVRFSLNGGEEISFNLNGETEYNEDKYYLEVVSESDSRQRVCFEVIFGIKDGIPDNKELKFIFEDPNGVPSNTYLVKLDADVDPLPEEPTREDKTQGKTNKNNKNPTKGEKTTKTKESTVVVLHIGNAHNDNGTDEGKFINSKVLFISAAAVVLAGLLITGGMQYLKRKKHKGDKG